MKAYGERIWLIPDGYISGISHNIPSHDSVCVLNTSDTDAMVNLTLYFEDRDKMDCFKAQCKAGRTHHIRMDKIIGINGEQVPKDMPYAILVDSDVEIVVQYSRLDTTQAEMALMSTMAYHVK